jgi:CheY-like chemotaxis protein
MVERVKTLRALVVEDDRMIQTIIKANLESIGIKPLVAGNGVEAIAAIKENEFDFILMDIRMPDQDGLDATRWIRDIEFNDAVRHIPIFALTTYSSEAHTQEILAAGMDEHLVKPFKLENLLPLLDKYFPGVRSRT